MSASNLSRRQLLGGLLAAVGGWLIARPLRAATPSPRPILTVIDLRGEPGTSTTYRYDAQARCTSVTDHLDQVVAYPYDG